MSSKPCGAPDCPVPDPGELDLRSLTKRTIEAGTRWWNVTRHIYDKETFNVSGTGSARFSPLVDPSGRNVGSVYLGASRAAAFLESVLHDDIDFGPPTTFLDIAELEGLKMRRFTQEQDLGVVDLSLLDALGISSTAIAHSHPDHYECTRMWGECLRSWGRQPNGVIWQSRMSREAAKHSVLLGEFANTSATEVAVIYDTHTAKEAFRMHSPSEDLAHGSNRELLLEICGLLDVALM